MAYYNGNQLGGLRTNMTVVDDEKLKELSLSNEPYNNKKVNDVNNIVGYKGYKMIGYTLSSDNKSVDIELRDAELEEKARDKYKVNDKVNIEADTHLYRKQIITAIRANLVERYLELNTVESYTWETNPVEGISTQTLTEIMRPGGNSYILCFGNPITFYIHTSADSEDKLTELGYIVGRQYEINFQNSELVSVGLVLESEDTSKCNTIITLEEVDGSDISFNLEEEDGTDIENWLYVPDKYVGEEIPQFSHAVTSGVGNIAGGYAALVGGRDNKVYGNYGTVFGRENIAAYLALATGRNTKALGLGSVTHGKWTEALAEYAIALGDYTLAEGLYALALGAMCHQGIRTQALADYAIALGRGVIAGSNRELGKGAIATGYQTRAYGPNSLTLGSVTQTGEQDKDSGANALAGGQYTKAKGKNSLTFGDNSETTHWCGLAIGDRVKSYNEAAVALCSCSIASAYASLAAGFATKTNTNAPFGQAALGKYNVGKTATIFEVGIGTSSERKNGFEVYSNGDAKINNSLILTDRTTGIDYKVYIDNGKLQLEEVTA